MIDITLNLPEDLLEAAKSVGVLTDEGVIQWLQAEIEQPWQKVRADLRAMLEQVWAFEPALTQKEIDAEIEAYKRERTQALTDQYPSINVHQLLAKLTTSEQIQPDTDNHNPPPSEN